ncbi:Activated RNA polymerase II transcriptional coactivator p15 [Tritrichomonas foetus]|uniref:Activated RNA polymerase II transcriptional coactivator p15 n=1 Tax=Tritrichomonas foetus TaxID=1144522 RepID=A0A1J4KBY2_9EUKA|nr:Activated RNA polymerase II transcriptional coactivator p15 [Tritrichomonas foetus]|eukprot:OHT06973.1 Activated RNA polymerase II transcriptional coactivator p15 [Tritrichomonas foetus]
MSYSEDESPPKQEMAQDGPPDNKKETKKPNLQDFSTKIKKEKAYVFPIGQNSMGKRQVQISKFKGKVRVDIREYYADDNDEWKPTKKGLSLDATQWGKLCSLMGMINEAIEELNDE